MDLNEIEDDILRARLKRWDEVQETVMSNPKGCTSMLLLFEEERLGRIRFAKTTRGLMLSHLDRAMSLALQALTRRPKRKKRGRKKKRKRWIPPEKRAKQS